MAEDADNSEKTEEPSQHRIDESRKKGEVASSKELNSVLILSGTLCTLVLSGSFIFETLFNYIDWMYTLDYRVAFTEEMIQEIFKRTMSTSMQCLAPMLLVSSTLGFLTQIAQVGFIFAPDVLQLKLERISPLGGLKRIASKKSIVEAIKGVFKFAIVLTITYSILKDNLNGFTGYLHSDVIESLGYVKFIILKLSMSILLGLLIVAMMDFAWEKYSHKQKLRMTKQQVKEEQKEKDGNPEVKQRIRNIQRQMSSKRMMSDIPSADAIVTNPTHLSIAIKYDPATMIAPEVIGKGSDHTALRIREIAKEHDIPIVENVPLARALYKTVKVGEGVPRTLYKTVAEILAFVYKVKKRKKAVS